ncbi:hypothetical protein [Leptolyngbya sp. Heron Island J]|uniref:hypothetical protein n=1 Tax=Leptolyngbya sp. Heron Island J TaxID=1385935 RepID=UPI0008FF012F
MAKDRHIPRYSSLRKAKLITASSLTTSAMGTLRAFHHCLILLLCQLLRRPRYSPLLHIPPAPSPKQHQSHLN